MRSSNDTIGNRNRGLSACSAVPLRTAHFVSVSAKMSAGHSEYIKLNFGKTISLVTCYIRSGLHAHTKGQAVPHLQLDSNMSQIILIGRI